MTTHSLSDAQKRLPDLIESALAGEEVVITGEDLRSVRLAPVPARAGRGQLQQDLPSKPNDLEWLRRHRVGRLNPDRNAAQLIREMRDEGY